MSQSNPIPDKLTPIYTLAQVARIVGCHEQTLRTWVRGRIYASGGIRRKSTPVFGNASTPRSALTFLDLVEAHMLHLIRKGYGIPMKNFRTAIEYLHQIGGDLHYLARKDFLHDQRHLYLKENEKLISLSERGQHVNTSVIKDGLKQLMYGHDGYAGTFFPLIGGRHQEVVMVNPQIGYGQPVLYRLGVNIGAISARFDAGTGIQELADDYGAETKEIEEALRSTRVLCA